MRNEGGFEIIKKAIAKLETKHAQHIAAYGEGNERRLTGKHETASIHKFSWVNCFPIRYFCFIFSCTNVDLATKTDLNPMLLNEKKIASHRHLKPISFGQADYSVYEAIISIIYPGVFVFSTTQLISHH